MEDEFSPPVIKFKIFFLLLLLLLFWLSLLLLLLLHLLPRLSLLLLSFLTEFLVCESSPFGAEAEEASKQSASAEASTDELAASIDAREVDEGFAGETKSGLAVKQGSFSGADERIEVEEKRAEEEEVGGEMVAGKTLEDLFRLFKGRLLPAGNGKRWEEEEEEWDVF